MFRVGENDHTGKANKRVANHKSAIKAHRKQEARRASNREYRSRLRRVLKTARSAADAGTPDDATVAAQVRETVSLVDKMAQKGVIHANAAARHKARLVRRLRKPVASA